MSQENTSGGAAAVHEKRADSAAAPVKKRAFDINAAWFFVAVAALVTVLVLPIESLNQPGQVALAMLAFAVIMWVTEAVSYPVSALLIVGLISVILGLTPDPENPGEIIGTSKALGVAMDGFSSSAVALVAAALILAGAMQVTGLHKRIALVVLKVAGEKTSHIVAGAIVIARS